MVRLQHRDQRVEVQIGEGRGDQLREPALVERLLDDHHRHPRRRLRDLRVGRLPVSTGGGDGVPAAATETAAGLARRAPPGANGGSGGGGGSGARPGGNGKGSGDGAIPGANGGKRGGPGGSGRIPGANGGSGGAGGARREGRRRRRRRRRAPASVRRQRRRPRVVARRAGAAAASAVGGVDGWPRAPRNSDRPADLRLEGRAGPRGVRGEGEGAGARPAEGRGRRARTAVFPGICSRCVSSTPSDSSFAHVSATAAGSAHTVMKMNDAERAVCGPAACHCSSRSAVSVPPAHSNAPIVKRIGSPKAARRLRRVRSPQFSGCVDRDGGGFGRGAGARRVPGGRQREEQLRVFVAEGLAGPRSGARLLVVALFEV